MCPKCYCTKLQLKRTLVCFRTSEEISDCYCKTVVSINWSQTWPPVFIAANEQGHETICIWKDRHTWAIWNTWLTGHSLSKKKPTQKKTWIDLNWKCWGLKVENFVVVKYKLFPCIQDMQKYKLQEKGQPVPQGNCNYTAK